jgi:hypothetical protein
VVLGCNAPSFSAGASVADTQTQGALVIAQPLLKQGRFRMGKMGHSGMEEPRIQVSREERIRMRKNFAQIEGMEARKQEVLARCRAEKEARKRR